MEEILKQILIELKEVKADTSGLKQDVLDMKQDILSMKQDISGLKQGQENMKQDILGVKQDISELKQGQENMKQDILGVKQDISELKQDMVLLKSQSNENILIARALREANELNKATLDAMTLDIADIKGKTISLKEQVARLDTDVYAVKVISNKNHSDISQLKAQ